MKFSDKLIKLRKEKGMSQEELGDKLGVTRQTISKWELGQATPNMTNLNELGTLFNVSINYLVDDNCDSYNKQFKGGIKMDDNKKKKIVIIVAIVLGIIVVGSVIKLAFFNTALDKVNDAKDAGTQAALDVFNKGMENINNMDNQNSNNNSNLYSNYEYYTFNSNIELFAGSQNATFTKQAINAIVSSNSKNTEHQISVEFEGATYTSTSDILDLNNKIENDKTYNILLNYDAAGYINNVIIK